MISIARTTHFTSQIAALLDSSSNFNAGHLGVEQSAIADRNRSIRELLSRFDLEGPEILADRIENAIDEEGLTEQHRQEASEAAEIAGIAAEIMDEEEPDNAPAKPAKKKGKAWNYEKHAGKDIDVENGEIFVMKKKYDCLRTPSSMKLMATSASETLSRLHEALNNLRREKAALTGRLIQTLGSTTLL